MDIHSALFWGCTVACVVAELLILRDTFAGASDLEGTAHIPHSPRGVEILWAVLPAIALAALLWFAWRATV